MAKFHTLVTLVLTTSIAAALAPVASAATVRAVEYYHQAFEHYFVTANPAEIAALDSGMFQGWWRTGQRYRVDDVPVPDLAPVCRFFTAAFAGKASHFFTASAAECEMLKKSPYWTYEGIAFYARVPDAQGNCAPGAASIHRLFNNGQGGAPNHAYTAYAYAAWGSKWNKLVDSGWISEGVAFCVPLAVDDPATQLQAFAASNWDLPRSLFPLDGHDPIFETRFLAPMQACWDDCVFDAPYPYAPDYFYPYITLVDRKNGHWWGIVMWDPLSGSYVVDGVNVGDEVWTFDNPLGPSTPVCVMRQTWNLVSENPPLQHGFQPFLYSGCEQGVAGTH